MTRETVGNEIRRGDFAATGHVAPASNRNLLYNGAMQVAQRGTSTASITTAGYFTADRWYHSNNAALGTWTQSVENDAPTGSGLRKSLKMLCTTADAAPAAGDYCIIEQVLEGQDLQRIAKGTASAQQLTFSFWVKSNNTGTYVCQLRDDDNNRSVSASYTVSASATWERKTITFASDTTGAFDNDNAGSLRVRFWLSAGSTYTSGTLNSVWQGEVAANVAAGQTNLAAAVNNYWQITGVQLETGPVATEFEHRSFGDELARCQRYYYKPLAQVFSSCSSFGLSNSYTNSTYFPVTLRATPTITTYDGDATFNPVNAGKANWYPGGAILTATIETINKESFSYRYTGSGSYTGTICNYTANAEL